jgi:hypothetical protein
MCWLSTKHGSVSDVLSNRLMCRWRMLIWINNWASVDLLEPSVDLVFATLPPVG